MAYKGYLVKIGTYVFPMDLIKAETLTVTRSGQDLDSYRDSVGYLHRTALDNFLYKAEWETITHLTDKQYEEIWWNIKAQYKNATEKKVNVSIYCPEIQGYAEGSAYIPDVSQTIFYADDKEVIYDQTRFAVITYGKEK